MITTNLQLDGKCLESWAKGERDGFLWLELPVGGERVEVAMRRPAEECFTMPTEEARPLTLDEAAETVFRMATKVMASQKRIEGGGL